MTVSVMWFRRDLRLHDNPALLAAQANGNQVLPVFILDPQILETAGEMPLAFFLRNLRSLQESLNEQLVVRVGDPQKEIPRLAAEVGASTVFCTESFTPAGMARDAEVAQRLAYDNRELQTIDSPYAVAPGATTKVDGSPFKVFTPFFRAWNERLPSLPRPAPKGLKLITTDSEAIPDDPKVDSDLLPAGEKAALQRLNAFVKNDFEAYSTARDSPGDDRTSRLSPYLRFGCLHPRQILSALQGKASANKFVSELCWREFHADVLFHNPDSLEFALQPKMRSMQIDTGPPAEELFALWKQGQTGYPIVDAGMRQLLCEGFMHNRVRMIVASFLVKDLHIDWRWGADWFLQLLLDGDIASNTHNWQWVAGTGTDAAPYFRIFNPVTQSKKFDSDGEYIRRWVPELRDLDNKLVHEPWKSPLESQGYSAPIVDHAEERQEALRRYAAIK